MCMGGLRGEPAHLGHRWGSCLVRSVGRQTQFHHFRHQGNKRCAKAQAGYPDFVTSQMPSPEITPLGRQDVALKDTSELRVGAEGSRARQSTRDAYCQFGHTEMTGRDRTPTRVCIQQLQLSITSAVSAVKTTGRPSRRLC